MRYYLLIVTFFYFGVGNAYQSYENVKDKLTLLFAKIDSKEISAPEALLTIDENDIDFLLKPSVIDPSHHSVIAKGHIGCSGAVQGVLCFNLNDLEAIKTENKPIIWVTNSLNNDDLCHLQHFAGIFAINEDPSSHAIIVTRVYNIPCITLPSNVIIKENELITPSGVFGKGCEVTLDAFNGTLIAGHVPLQHKTDDCLLNKISELSELYARLEVHGNADNAKEAQEALDFGATGVDPRTEHMFFQPERLQLFRKAILSKGQNEEVLTELKELQKGDFVALYKTMQMFPVKIRLLDPPLHEFLPNQEENLISLAKDLDISLEDLKKMVKSLQETNPMMGHRGVRLLLTYPEILKMQIKAIFEASLHPSLKDYRIIPHIVVPMIICSNEVILIKSIVEDVYREISSSFNIQFSYKLGIMMETPRACLTAGEISPYIDFISFGTNDLTGQTLALSRGDVYDKFLKYYLEEGLLPSDPFSDIDPAVKELMRICVDQIKAKNSNVVVGICGEHAGQRTGVFICHQLGFNTVSCAAFRVPAVKLFAAQAAILHPR